MSKSPFPGMDPWLEAHWLDVHQRLCTYICDQLQEQLPSDLCSRLEERIVLEDEGYVAIQHRHPDVLVVEDEGGTSSGSVAVRVATADPVELSSMSPRNRSAKATSKSWMPKPAAG